MELKKIKVGKKEKYYVDNGNISREISKKLYEFYYELLYDELPNSTIYTAINKLKSIQISDNLGVSSQNDTKIDISLPNEEEINIEEYIIRQNKINGFTVSEIFELIKNNKIDEALIQGNNGVKRWVFNTGLEVLDEEIENQEIYMDIFFERHEIIEFDGYTVPNFDEYYKENTKKLTVEQEKELAESSKLCQFNIFDIKQRNESGGHYLYEIIGLRKHCNYLAIQGEDELEREVFEDGVELDYKEGETYTLGFDMLNQKYKIIEINDISLHEEEIEVEPQKPYYQEAKFNEVVKKFIDVYTYKIMAINPENENDYIKFNRGDFMESTGRFNVELFLDKAQKYLTWDWHYRVDVK